MDSLGVVTKLGAGHFVDDVAAFEYTPELTREQLIAKGIKLRDLIEAKKRPALAS